MVPVSGMAGWTGGGAAAGAGAARPAPTATGALMGTVSTPDVVSAVAGAGTDACAVAGASS